MGETPDFTKRYNFYDYRKTPVCPSEYLPGCGYTHSPCGPPPPRNARQQMSVAGIDGIHLGVIPPG